MRLPLALVAASVTSIAVAQNPCKLVKDINAIPLPAYTGANPDLDTPNQSSAFWQFVKCGSWYYYSGDSSEHGSDELWRTDGNGTCELACDPTGPGISTFLGGIVCCDGKIFFEGNISKTSTTNYELCVYDPATKVCTTIDINGTTSSSSIDDIVCCGDKVYFEANDGTNGSELWVSDGTAAGTMMLKDIYAGSSSSSPSNLTCAGTKLFFSAFTSGTGGTGRELWVTDGTPAGTVLVQDINSGTSSSSPTYIRALGNKVVFRANDGTSGSEMWVSDGSSAGTMQLKDIRAGTSSGVASGPLYGNVALGKFWFSANDGTTGDELWVTDGTPAGTVFVKDIRGSSTTTSSAPRYFTECNGKVYFQANDGTNGVELWSSDGTTAGTNLVTDIYSGSSSSSPQYLVCIGTKLYFRASNASSAGGTEVYVSDGTAAGTMSLDLVPGTSSSSPTYLTPLSATTFLYNGYDGAVTQLMVSDGTQAGTKPACTGATGLTGNAFPSNLTDCKGTLYFYANDGSTGTEPWISDGTAAGTTMLKDINPGSSNSTPFGFTSVGDGSSVVFRANDGTNGTELWVTDGTPTGTKLLLDIRSGSSSASPTNFTTCGGKVFFTANDGTNGTELWMTDGTLAGTKMVKDLYPGSSSSSPSYLTCCKGKLYFSAFVSGTGGTGRELWVSDGTEAGTTIVKDIYPGTSSSSPTYLCCAGDKIFFSANDGTNGKELWMSDGTDAGTVLIKDLTPGSASTSFSTDVTCCNGKYFFECSAESKGTEPWVSDGTAAGTMILLDINSGSSSSSPDDPVCCGDKVFFEATDGSSGLELYVTDMTPAGTMRVADLYSGSSSSSPAYMTCVGNRCYFSAFVSGTGATGRELYVSDGTSAGTKIVCDLVPGSGSSSMVAMAVSCGKLFFRATDPKLGAELFVAEEPGAHAWEIGSSCGASAPKLTATAPVLGGSSQVTLSSGPTGNFGLLMLGAPFAPNKPYYTRNSAAACYVYIDFPILHLATYSAPGGTGTIPIPNDAALQGLKVALQSFWVTTTTIGDSSNGVEVRIGG